MDYEKLYKEALERAKEKREESFVPSDIEYIFPELKESKDEKIRKAIFKSLSKKDARDVLLANGIQVSDALAWLEKQGESYTKKAIDDAYLKGVTDAKNEIEKQYRVNYQIRKNIAAFIFNYKGYIKDRAKWMDYLGIKVFFVEKQCEQKHI